MRLLVLVPHQLRASGGRGVAVHKHHPQQLLPPTSATMVQDPHKTFFDPRRSERKLGGSALQPKGPPKSPPPALGW